MAKCKQCGKSGLFLKLKNGYCEECFEKIAYYQFTAPQWYRIVNDSVQIMNTTKDLDTFFSRYDLALLNLQNLIDSEPYIGYEDQTPSIMLEKLQEQIDKSIDELLCKYFQATDDKLSSLKTAKSKENNFNKFVENVECHTARFSDANKKLCSTLIQTAKKHLES